MSDVRETPKILLLLQHGGNLQLLASWLSQHRYATVTKIEDVNQSFDLVILDPPMLLKQLSMLKAMKSSVAPVHLPFILITSRQDTGRLPSEFWNVIDELLLTPVDPVELRARVRMMLSVRQDSVDLKRTNDIQEAFITELTGAFEVAESESALTDILLKRAMAIAGRADGAVIVSSGAGPRVASIRGPIVEERVDSLDLGAVLARAGTSVVGRDSPDVNASVEDDGLVVMPVAVRGEMIGVLVLLGEAQRFGTAESRLLHSLCGQAGVFLHNLRQGHRLVEAAYLYQQIELAEAVQRQLLPAPSSGLKSFETGTAYKASNGVGGDYYDIIDMEGGRVAVVVADVAGHSLSSGLVMTAARSAFRALLQQESSPAKLVRQLNQLLLLDLERTGVFISLCVIVADAQANTIAYANAGHCSPLLMHEGETSPIFLEATGMPLGILHEANYSEETMSVRARDIIVLYTDGITEARNDTGEFWGEEGLWHCVQATASKNPSSISDAIVDGATRHSGNSFTDDLTVLVLKVKDGEPHGSQQGHSAVLATPATLEQLAEIRRWIAEQLQKWAVPEVAAADVLTAVTEICSNAIVHGFADADSGEIEIALHLRGKALEICIEDNAEAVPLDDGVHLPDDPLAEGGYGRFLAGALMDRVTYALLEGKGNKTTLVKAIAAPE